MQPLSSTIMQNKEKYTMDLGLNFLVKTNEDYTESTKNSLISR